MCANRNDPRFRLLSPPVPSAPCRANPASTAVFRRCADWRIPSPHRLGMDSAAASSTVPSIVASRAEPACERLRSLLDGKHNGHPGPLGALTHYAYGIFIEPFPPDSVIENRAHDVSSLRLDSVCILQRTEPLLHRNCLYVGNVIASAPRQNPLSEIARVGDLRLPRFGAVRPQFFFPVVFDKLLNTDRSQTGAWTLRVDVCPKCGDSFLSRCLVRILFERSNHQIASSSAAIRLEFIPPILPSLLAARAINKLKAALLKSRPSRHDPPWLGTVRIAG
jgi:hypothetical protein